MINQLTSFLLVLFMAWLRIPCLAQVSPSLKHALVITELYPDPDPRAGLPISEFIELKNVSVFAVNLKGWKIGDATGIATISAGYELKPDSFVVVCPPSAVAGFRVFGAAIGLTGFPSLNNEEDLISLYDPAGELIHHVHYQNTWYRNDVKKEGGWTLEVIDPLNFCSGATNWKASERITGGTPGSINSVNSMNPDEESPAVLKSYTKNNKTFVVIFDKGLDSLKAAVVSHYKISGSDNSLMNAIPIGPAFEEVELILTKAMQPETVYELVITGVTDCAGNTIGQQNKVKFGLPSSAETADVVINELLFNPPGSGYDYVELYNRSKKIIDLQEIMLASKSSSGNLVNITSASKNPGLLFPNEYLVLTENRSWLQQNYMIKDEAAVNMIADLPSLPDDKGYLTVINSRGTVVDEITYSDKWHFALLNNKEGVALERIDFAGATNDRSNWTSAASAAGFGTPGYQNSQFRADLQVQGQLVIEPKLFSPDNDGYHDQAGLYYEMAEPGYMGSITIYDAAGRPVRFLVKSAILGMKGIYNWDGLDENLKKLPAGIYVVLMEVFNLKGRVRKIKNSLTLARKF